MTYIDVRIETEPVDLAEEAFDYLGAQVPGWLPSPGNLEAWLIESLALIASELRTLCAAVPDSIFMYYGESILSLPPYQAQQATGSTTWTAIDTAGYTVYAGTLLALRPPASNEAYAYEVVDDFSIPAGQTTATAISIRAIEAGTGPSGLSGALEMIDVLDFISTVTLAAPTSGGVDAETADQYLSRLSDLMTLLAPRPILPNDFSLMVQKQIPGVARATAIDLYKLDTAQANQPRCCTVAVCDSAGEPCSTTVKNAADALLQSQREINFLAFIADPTYTVIDVTVDYQQYPGYVVADVQQRVQAALTSYLSPANWGLPPYGDLSGLSWLNTTTVRYLELAEVVNRVDGVNYINTLTFRKSGGTLATSDVALTGIAPLTRPGSINVTGHAPA